MSFKDEIREDLKRFTDPVKQDIKNARDDIADAIYDSTHKNESGGCLKKILIYGFIILVVLAFLKNGCSFNSTIERDGAGSTASQEQSGMSKENLYNTCILVSEENVDELLAQNPINEAELWSEYEFLLTCLSSEYMFKVMAYGHFTGEYEPERFDSIVKKSDRIVEEMKRYFDAEAVEEQRTAIAAGALGDFDESAFDYESCLIGSRTSPDVNAMWEAYFDALVNEAD